MFSTAFSISRTLRSTPLVALMLLGCGALPILSQSPTGQPTRQQPGIPAMRDLTRPQSQPRLDVDRDPIPSPDPDEPASASTTPSTGKPGELQKRQDGVYTMHQEVDEVLLACAVVDDKGQTASDLKRNNFRVWEDGIPQEITSFLHQDQAVSLGIIVDNSGSMRDKRPAVNAAALSLLKASNPQDSSFIVNFSDHAFLDQGFTSNIEALNRALTRSDSKGTTALYDAVAASADELSNHAKLPKQVLLVITDGADNASRLDLEQAIHRVQTLGGPVVYTIGLLFDTNKEEAARARRELERMSQETGGIAYFPDSLQDVDPIAIEVARDIRDQYTIGYRSSKAASLGGFRTVRVEASEPRHHRLIVRTRSGYYANKPAPQRTQTADAAKAAETTKPEDVTKQ
jgi:Ca-activated chloride channel family protein